METGTSGCEIDRSIHALRRRPLSGNRARSARGGRASVLLVGAGGAWRAGPPCRPEEARRARAVGHRGTADGGTKVEGAGLARDRSCSTGVRAYATPTWISTQPPAASACPCTLHFSYLILLYQQPCCSSAARRHEQVLYRESSYTCR
jgi:hypothetical protein